MLAMQTYSKQYVATRHRPMQPRQADRKQIREGVTQNFEARSIQRLRPAVRVHVGWPELQETTAMRRMNRACATFGTLNDRRLKAAFTTVDVAGQQAGERAG